MMPEHQMAQFRGTAEIEAATVQRIVKWLREAPTPCDINLYGAAIAEIERWCEQEGIGQSPTTEATDAGHPDSVSRIV
jgi:hypothetical protein